MNIKICSKNSRYKGKISTETISGYFDYTGRDDAKVIEQQDGGFLAIQVVIVQGHRVHQVYWRRNKKEIHKYFYPHGNLC